jgi:hypothetical protein
VCAMLTYDKDNVPCMVRWSSNIASDTLHSRRK